MQANKILVTGINGVVSLRILEWLTNRGHVVENINLRDNGWKEHKLSEYKAIIHVAGIVPKTGAVNQEFYKINCELTSAFAKKAKEDGVSHFIYISSMAVYGKAQSLSFKKGLITENTPCNPTSDYGKSKLSAEECLNNLEDDSFLVTRVRVPSIYGIGKTEYLQQYKHLNQKFKRIPQVFTKNYKSIIYIDNLCELLHLIVTEKTGGVVCPDDGQYCAMDICCALSPNMKKSWLLGLLFKIILRKNKRVQDYYGAIYYEKKLTNVFDGKYRKYSLMDAIRIINKEG